MFVSDTNIRQINSNSSSGIEFWLNTLISGAFNNYEGVSACHSNEGNFYVENYTGNMPSDECGLVDITYYYDFGDGNVLIDWKKQSSVYDISYYVYGNDSLQLITDETIARFTPTVSYSYIKVRPYDNDNKVFGIADTYTATYPTVAPTAPSAPAEAVSGGSYPHGAPWYKNFTFCIEKENKTKIGIDAYPGYKYEGILIIKNLGNAGINVTISCSYDGIIDNPCEFTKIENTSLYVLPDETAYTGIEINVPKDIELGSYYYKLVAVDNNGIRNDIEIFLNVKKKTIIDAIKEKGKEAKEVIEESGMPLWFIILVVVLFISLVSYTIYYYKKKKWKGES
ncbi:MAG: hypothetical protein DRP74_07525 [Candidatus Omnitrophota bacterium]|nr:MAG: hypothetical protein DRP74_07525 [Candidatus Omnitrophota bacterium]